MALAACLIGLWSGAFVREEKEIVWKCLLYYEGRLPFLFC